MRHLTEEDLDRNFDAFSAALPQLIKANRGKFAVVRDGSLSGVYDTLLDAHKAGWRLFNDERFSVQEITDEPVCLGIYSYADDIRKA